MGLRMKKIAIILGLVLIASTAHSQVLISLLLGDKLNSPGLDFGLEGGITWSAMTGMESTDHLSTFGLGFYFDILLKNQLNLYTGVLVKSSLGLDELSQNDLDFLEADVYPEEGTYSQRISYFVVPVLLKYNFKNHIYLEAGPQASLMHKARVEFRSDNDGTESRIRQTNKDMIQRIDAGFSGGLGYRLQKGEGMTIGLRYYFGLVDVYKNRPGTKNQYLFLKFNVPIGAG